jgi:carboxylesterase
LSEVESTVDSSPFDLDPADYDGRRAALCLHGLTGTPFEMRRVADELVDRGVRCVAPVMAGHDSVEELSRTSHQQWVDAAREHFERLASEAETVFIVGLSMGGLVALALALENRAAAVAVMGTPVRLPWWLKLLVPIAKHVLPNLPKPSGGPDIKEPGARARHPGLEAMPVASIHEIVKLQEHVRPRLPGITLPLLVAHGAKDRTANPRNASAIFSAINSGERALFKAASSAHVISVDYDAAEVARAVGDFLLSASSAGSR